MAFVHHHFAQCTGRLAVAKAGAKHIRCAQRARGGMHARVRNQAEHAAFAGYFLNTHLHAAMHCAYQHVYFIALHQLGGVFYALGRLRFVIYFKKLYFAASQLAALLCQRHAKTVFDGHTQLRKGTGAGQHQADADFAALRACDLRQQKACASRTH